MSAIGSADSYKDVLENPDRISKAVLAKGLDSNTAFEILSIDIADVDVGDNIGAKLQSEQADADKRIAQAKAEAEKVKIEAQARAEAEAMRIRTVAEATAESIRQVNTAIREGGESYLRYRQVEMLPDIAPVLADALAKAKMVTIAGGGGGAAESVMSNITSVIQTVLAAQLVTKGGLLSGVELAHSHLVALKHLCHVREQPPRSAYERR